MKFNRLIILLLLTLCSILNANEPLIQKKKVSLEIALPLLESIDQYSIIVGSGPTQMYVFIDPLCPRSQDFVDMVFDNKKMQKLYSYHFFFYELKRFKTKKIIAEILNSKDPISKMNMIMIKKEKTQGLEMIPISITNKIDSISKVAGALDIYKRPYLFIVKAKKGNI